MRMREWQGESLNKSVPSLKFRDARFGVAKVLPLHMYIKVLVIPASNTSPSSEPE